MTTSKRVYLMYAHVSLTRRSQDEPRNTHLVFTHTEETYTTYRLLPKVPLAAI